MGEDFSLAQTLRLAFVHTMAASACLRFHDRAEDLAGTGVVGALRKARCAWLAYF